MKRTAVDNSKDPVEASASISKNLKANETIFMTSYFSFKLKSKEHPYGSPTTKYSETILKYENGKIV